MKTKKLLNAVEDGTQTAVEYITPYVEQALREGGSLAGGAYSRVRPALKDVGIRSARLASETFEKVHPVLDDALDKVSPAVDATVKAVQPAVDEALQRIPPTVDSARAKLQADYLPYLAALLRERAVQPLARELEMAATSAALAAELDQAAKPKRSKWRTFGKILLAGAAIVGAVTAVRKLLADPSTGWETHTPKTAYVADPVADLAEDAEAATESVEEETVSLADQAAGVAADLAEAAEDTGKAANKAKQNIEDELDKLADAAEGSDASPLANDRYPEGYVGEDPPPGFIIKGNDRSMKYHVPGSAAYERTIAEVWFRSEEDAQAAGFVRAQR